MFLTGLIMRDPCGEKEFEDDENGKYNPLASLEVNTLSKFYNGDRSISKKNAAIIHGRFDKTKFIDEIYGLPDDSKESLQQVLNELGIKSTIDNVDEVCADMFGQLLYNISQGNNEFAIATAIKRNSSGKRISEVLNTSVYYEDGKLYIDGETIELPEQMAPPDDIEPHEQAYINALCNAYAHALCQESVTKEDINKLPKLYQVDFSEQRKSYYGAEYIHRSVREIYDDGENQFNILKGDAYEGIRETYWGTYPNGYERLRAVLIKITSTTLEKSKLSLIKNLVGNLEKKGICHILVNDDKIKSWVDINA